MKGYPKYVATKRDYINLLADPEFAEQARADLAMIAILDDDHATIDHGTEDAPDIEVIENPMPLWKQKGFASREEVLELLSIQ